MMYVMAGVSKEELNDSDNVYLGSLQEDNMMQK